VRSTAYADSLWLSYRHFVQLRARRCAAALVVVAVHVTLFVLMRAEVLRQPSVAEMPVFVSIFVPDQMRGLRTTGRARAPARSGGTRASRVVPREARPKETPQPIAPPPPLRVDWLGEAELAARDQIASEADHKRRSDWLSRGTDPETHPLALALKPMFGKTPEFGWSHEHTHRIEHPPGGPLVFWINKRCVLAFVGLAIIPACAIGHMEPNGALFEHMNDADLDFTPAP
jgi:hypothetical protein